MNRPLEIAIRHLQSHADDIYAWEKANNMAERYGRAIRIHYRNASWGTHLVRHVFMARKRLGLSEEGRWGLVPDIRYRGVFVRSLEPLKHIDTIKRPPDSKTESLPHDIQAILTGVPARDIVETHTDPRISRLLKRVNSKNIGTAKDLEALFHLAKRARKKLIWTPENSRDSTTVITDVLDKKPSGRGWMATNTDSRTPREPHEDERIFVVGHHSHNPAYLWTYDEIIRHSSWVGFDVV